MIFRIQRDLIGLRKLENPTAGITLVAFFASQYIRSQKDYITFETNKLEIDDPDILSKLCFKMKKN